MLSFRYAQSLNILRNQYTNVVVSSMTPFKRLPEIENATIDAHRAHSTTVTDIPTAMVCHHATFSHYPRSQFVCKVLKKWVALQNCLTYLNGVLREVRTSNSKLPLRVGESSN